MSLDNFFRINLPYGLRRVTKNRWIVFNREYQPLGWNSKSQGVSIYAPDSHDDLPISTAYEGLTEELLLRISWNDIDGVQRDKDGKIDAVFLYNDRSNPNIDPNRWPEYFEKIKLLANLDVARPEVRELM